MAAYLKVKEGEEKYVGGRHYVYAKSAEWWALDYFYVYKDPECTIPIVRIHRDRFTLEYHTK